MASLWITTAGGRKPRAGKTPSLPTHGTQADRLLAALRRKPKSGLTPPEILALGIAVYSARFVQLRDLGWRIECRHRWTVHPRTGRRMMESVYFLKS